MLMPIQTSENSRTWRDKSGASGCLARMGPGRLGGSSRRPAAIRPEIAPEAPITGSASPSSTPDRSPRPPRRRPQRRPGTAAAKAARHDRPEGQQPQAIDGQMGEVVVQPHIADERHGPLQPGARIDIVRRQEGVAVARRDEGIVVDPFGRRARAAPACARHARRPVPRSATATTAGTWKIGWRAGTEGWGCRKAMPYIYALRGQPDKPPRQNDTKRMPVRSPPDGLPKQGKLAANGRSVLRMRSASQQIARLSYRFRAARPIPNAD